MVEVSIEREFDYPSERLWAVIADFGNVSWVPGVQKVELEGEGVGMIRHLTITDDQQYHERLEAIDHAGMILDYSLPVVPFIQVKDYSAKAQVFALDGERCKVVWSCKAEADGADEAQATTNTELFYESILTWIGDFLKR